ncbi:sigma-70 family RNA polymerase sigma factor [Actinosynnema sp. NPDC047251]|uniref:RNA polymerase sigma-70 factor, ECF subfamily n=1 Tax=Saccharothrix espanaensis (strain ATCC 51144 / DSM 44229 / JCM 9112 / NBRC 15066 / NRRL 15764) TaxID=1179773 RepID=K0JU34_SACES|nr:sigma-70 family RNA polymerase sigma factor [Saccharothrix espanaensis]CCH31330.1 RNA polymerase sigma-70 factor, ECF subfamily [Saccharothrix espanaensis DSM 44229]
MSSTRSDRHPAGGKPFEDYEGLAGLFVSARDGDRESLGRIVEVLTPVLWQVARAQGLDRERAGDAVQTAWLRLLGAMADIQSPRALTAWLVTVTKRESWSLRDEQRGHDLVGIAPDEELPDPGPRPDEEAVFADRRTRLWAAVGRLSHRCRELLRVVAFVGRADYSEISAALGMPRGSIGPTRGRCLAQLRKQLLADQEGSWR